MKDDLRNIDTQRSRWIRAINDCSAGDFVAVISDAAVWLPSGTEAISGKENIRAWLAKPFSELDYKYSATDVRLRMAGGWAVEQAAFTSQVSTKAGEHLPPHKGHYILLWKKEKTGVWLIERYIDLSAEFMKIDQGAST